MMTHTQTIAHIRPQIRRPWQALTALGLHLSRLPVHPRIGKMMLFGSIFGCLDPVLTIAASLSFKDPFVVPLHRQQEADRVRRRLAGDSRSDHLALLRAFEGWRGARGQREERDYCWEHFLSASTLQMIANLKRQFMDLLRDAGFVESEAAANAHSDHDRLVLGVLCAGLYPNIIRVEHAHGRKFGQRPPKLFTHEDGRVNLHPKSVICEERMFPTKFLLYHEKVGVSDCFGRQVCEAHNAMDSIINIHVHNTLPYSLGAMVARDTSCLYVSVILRGMSRVYKPVML